MKAAISANALTPELVEVLSVDALAIHEEHLRGLITEHVQHTGSQRGEEILANWSTFATKFALVKPKSSDVKALLGHRSRSAELSCACRRSKG